MTTFYGFLDGQPITRVQKSKPADKDTLFGVPIRLALWRITQCIGGVVWRTMMRKHINRLIAEDGAKI